MDDYKELIEMLRSRSKSIIHEDAELVGIPEENIWDADANALADAADAIEQLVKERDAAVADLTVFYKCKICKHYNEKSANYGYTEFCENCGAYPWADDEETNKWEWRGLQEDNT